MKTLILITLLILITGNGSALDNETGKEPQKKPEATAVTKESTRKTTKKDQTPEWPRPYKPTEEISADSIVPFPTDI